MKVNVLLAIAATLISCGIGLELVNANYNEDDDAGEVSNALPIVLPPLRAPPTWSLTADQMKDLALDAGTDLDTFVFCPK